MIGLLTGTFDPVHEGHVALAKSALEQCGLQEVWFLVNPDPHHKLAQASLADRQAMVDLAVLSEPSLRSGVLPSGLSALPHTWGNFRRIMNLFPDEKFEFIVGMDVIARLDSWDEIQSVVYETSYIVAHRAGVQVDELDGLRQRLGPLRERLQVRLVELGVPLPVSSTMIRQQVGAGKRPASIAVPVADYIQQRGLYCP